MGGEVPRRLTEMDIRISHRTAPGAIVGNSRGRVELTTTLFEYATIGIALEVALRPPQERLT